MKLYHWTNIRWLEGIMEAGVITVTDSNLAGPTRDDLAPYMSNATEAKAAAKQYRSHWTSATAPKVVWLTDNPVVDPTYLGMIDTSGAAPRPVPAHMIPAEFDKRRVRITIEVPDAEARAGWWPHWARKMGIREAWYRHLAEGHRSPKEWFVVVRPIAMSEFVAIDIDGDQVWPKTGLSLSALREKFGRALAGLLSH